VIFEIARVKFGINRYQDLKKFTQKSYKLLLKDIEGICKKVKCVSMHARLRVFKCVCAEGKTKKNLIFQRRRRSIQLKRGKKSKLRKISQFKSVKVLAIA
jgi:hypothetical protein